MLIFDQMLTGFLILHPIHVVFIHLTDSENILVPIHSDSPSTLTFIVIISFFTIL